MTNAQIYRLRDIAPHWFEDYRDRGNSVVDTDQAMLDDARHWSTYSDPTDPDIAGWYIAINADAAKAVAYLEGLDL
jgi:hypothetical protein